MIGALSKTSTVSEELYKSSASTSSSSTVFYVSETRPILTRGEDEELLRGIAELKGALIGAGIPPRIFLKSQVSDVIRFSLTIILCRCISSFRAPFSLKERASDRAIVEIVQGISAAFFPFSKHDYVNRFERVVAPKKIAKKYETVFEKIAALVQRDPLGEAFFYSSESLHFQEEDSFRDLLLILKEVQRQYSDIVERVMLVEIIRSSRALESWYETLGNEGILIEKEKKIQRCIKCSLGEFSILLSAFQKAFFKMHTAACEFTAWKGSLETFFFSQRREFHRLLQESVRMQEFIQRPIGPEMSRFSRMNLGYYPIYSEGIFYRIEMDATAQFIQTMSPYKELLTHMVLSVIASYGDEVNSNKIESAVSFLEGLVGILQKYVEEERNPVLSEELSQNPFFREIEGYLDSLPITMQEKIAKIEKSLDRDKTFKGSGIKHKPIKERVKEFSRSWFMGVQRALEELKHSENFTFTGFLNQVASYGAVLDDLEIGEVSGTTEIDPEIDAIVLDALDPSIPLIAQLSGSLDLIRLPIEIISSLLEPWESVILANHQQRLTLGDLTIEKAVNTKDAKKKSSPKIGEKTEKPKETSIERISPIPLISLQAIYFGATRTVGGEHKIQSAYYWEWGAEILYTMSIDPFSRGALRGEIVYVMDLATEQLLTDLTLRYNPDCYQRVKERHDLAYRAQVGGFATPDILCALEHLGTRGASEAKYPDSRRGRSDLATKLLTGDIESHFFTEAKELFEGHFNVYIGCLQKVGDIPHLISGEEGIVESIFRMKSIEILEKISFSELEQDRLNTALLSLQELEKSELPPDAKLLIEEAITCITWVLRGGLTRRLYPIVLHIMLRTTEYAIFQVLRDRLLEKGLKREGDFTKEHRLAPLFSDLYFGKEGFSPLFQKLKKTKNKGLDYFVALPQGRELLEAELIARIPSGFQQKGAQTKSLEEIGGDFTQRAEDSIELLLEVWRFL